MTCSKNRTLDLRVSDVLWIVVFEPLMEIAGHRSFFMNWALCLGLFRSVVVCRSSAMTSKQQEVQWWQNTEYDFEAGDEEDAYEKSGSPWIGERVLRVFGARKVQCVVESWLPPEKNEGRAFWRVRHEDLDDEDLELHELEEAKAAYEAERRDEEEEEEEGENDEKAAPKDSFVEEKKELLVNKIEETTAPEWPGITPTEESDDFVAFAAFRGLEAAAVEMDRGEAYYGECLRFFSEVGRTAPEPLRGLALYHAEVSATRCRRRHTSAKLPEDPQDACDLLEDAFALERVGVGSYDVKLHCEKIAKGIARKRGKAAAATAFLGFDPFGLSTFKKGTDLLDCVRDELSSLERRGLFPTRFRAVAGALYTAFFADRLGVDLVGSTAPTTTGETTKGGNSNNTKAGATQKAAGPAQSLFEEVLKTGVPLARALYSHEAERDWEAFLDQLLCVAALLECCSNFGDLQLRAWMVPDEYAVVVDPRCVAAAIARRDNHCVSDLARLARLFLPGDARARAVVDAAIPYLLSTRDATTGTWDSRGDVDLPYARFKAQADAVRALSEPTHRGFGPSLPGLADLLKAIADIDLHSVHHFAHCAVKLATTNKADALHANVYKGAGRPPDDDDDEEEEDHDEENNNNGKKPTLRDLAKRRLDGILKFKTLTDGSARFDTFLDNNDKQQQQQPKRRRRLLR